MGDSPYLPANQFARRVIRTERSALVQIRCLRCGFTTVGVKERIETVEKEHTTECNGSPGHGTSQNRPHKTAAA